MVKKIYLSKILEVAYLLFLICISVLAIMNLYSRSSSKKSVQILSVVSGSMSPSIDVGSAIVIKKEENYYVNDIISYRNQNKIITHRVIYSGKYYLTKGDANNIIDAIQIDKSQILGKVAFNIPWVGYIQESSKTLSGLIGFIYIPTLLIIVIESRQIVREFKKLEVRKLNVRPLIVLFIGAFFFIDQTYAYYSSKQLAFSGQITTVQTTPQPTASPISTPAATFSPTPIPSCPAIGNCNNGNGSTNTVIINNSSTTIVNQSNSSSSQTIVINNNSTASSSATITNQN